VGPSNLFLDETAEDFDPDAQIDLPGEEERIKLKELFLDLLEKHVQGELILGWDKKGNIQMRKKKQQGLNKTEEP